MSKSWGGYGWVWMPVGIVDSLILKVVLWVFWDRQWYVSRGIFPGGCAQERMKNTGENRLSRRKKLVNGANVPMQSDPSVELDGCWLGGGGGGGRAGRRGRGRPCPAARAGLGVPAQTLPLLQFTCSWLQLPSSHSHKLFCGSKKQLYSSLFHPGCQEWPERWWQAWQTPPMWIHSFILGAVLYHIDSYWIWLYRLELKGPAFGPLTLCPLCEPFLSGSPHFRCWGMCGLLLATQPWTNSPPTLIISSMCVLQTVRPFLGKWQYCLGRGEPVRVPKITCFEDSLGFLLELCKHYSCDTLQWKAAKQNQQRG